MDRSTITESAGQAGDALLVAWGRLREFVWPTDGRDPIARVLTIAVTTLMVAIIAVVGFAIVAVPRGDKPPRNQTERDLSMLEALTKTQSTNPKVWTDYANVAIGSGQYKLAADIIERGLDATKGSTQLLISRVRLYRAQGDLETALRECGIAADAAKKAQRELIQEMARKGVKAGWVANQDLADAEVLRGEIYAELLRWQEAVAAFGAALKEDPNMADVLAERGDAYVQLGQKTKAKADYEAALRLVPDYKAALDGLQRLSEGTGK